MYSVSSKNVIKSFQGGKKIKFPDISLEKGKALLIHGPSGCGKTTLLHLLAGLILPDEGSILIENTELQKLSSSEIDAFRGKNIGICFQKPVFIRSLNVLENLLMTQKLAGVPGDKKICLEILAELGLEKVSQQKTNSLSQGEQQRLVFIRALLNHPKLILADEPSSSLDDENTSRLMELMLSHSKTHGSSLVVVSHDERIKKFFDTKISLL
ncbi:MAG: ATP-binding cassette domain-containing protein [Saprospiraceae bacterium]|nr:ATP-binding cassette domain-containing protein [Saprospiraceae bacterium]